MLRDVAWVAHAEITKLRWWSTGWKLLALFLLGTQISLLRHRLAAVELGRRPLYTWAPAAASPDSAAVVARFNCDTIPAISNFQQQTASVAGWAARDCEQVRLARATQQQVEAAALHPAGAALDVIRLSVLGGLLLVVVLFSSIAGMEFGHGTIRPVLSRGLGRISFLLGKQVAGVAAVALALSAAVGLALATCHLYRGGLEVLPLESGMPRWLSVAATALRALGGVVVFGFYSMAIAVASRSVAIATSVSMVTIVAELLALATVRDAGPRIEYVLTHLPVCTIQRFAEPTATASGAFCRVVPDALPASLVLLVFAAMAQLWMVLTLVVRDVTSARGD
jgi:hypothetical protein